MGKKRVFLFLLFVSLFLFSTISFAQNAEIGSLVINQTKTMAGQEFYRIFVNLWRWPPWKKEEANIFISEKNSSRNGNILKIEAGDFSNKELVYIKRFSRQSKITEKDVTEGVTAANNYFFGQMQKGDN